MFLYLEPIFSFEDIKNNLPEESKKFELVNQTWREIMNCIKQDPLVLNVKKIPDLLKRLKTCRTYIE